MIVAANSCKRPPLRRVLILSSILFFASLFIAYGLLFLFKESGGFPSDVGFYIIWPVVLVEYVRSYVPDYAYWAIFIVIYYLYMLVVVYSIYCVGLYIRIIKRNS